jgi:O-antigen/teichoic acid export membrane protein
MWTLLGFGGAQSLRMASNLVLTRLIPMEAFGIMGTIVLPVLFGLTLFSDIGIGPNVIQNKREDDSFLDTAWTVQATRGLMLAVFAAALAWPLAVYYEQPLLLGLIPFVALSAFANGLRSSRMFTLNRNLAVGRLTMIEVGSQVAGIIVSIAWALVHPTVWALAAGAVVSPAAKMIMSHLFIAGPRHRIRWERAAVKQLFGGFARWVFVSTLLGYLASKGDRLAFGKLLDMEVAGVYAIAVLIAGVPETALQRLAMTVDFPLYSRAFRAGRNLADPLRSARRRGLLVGGWVLSLLVGGGPVFIELLYPASYAEAGWMVQILGAGLWFFALENSIGAALLARGESNLVAMANLTKVVAMAAFMPVGYVWWGLPGAIVGFASGEVCRYAFAMIAGTRAKLGNLRQDIGYTVVMVGTSAVGLGVARLTGALALHIAVQAAAIVVAVSLAWLPAAWPVLVRMLPGRRGGSPSAGPQS